MNKYSLLCNKKVALGTCKSYLSVTCKRTFEPMKYSEFDFLFFISKSIGTNDSVMSVDSAIPRGRKCR